MLKNLLLVAAGGSIGAVLRYAVLFFVKNQPFPFATLLINLAGSFILGIIMAWSFKNEQSSEGVKLFLATGICGGFTTFSGFTSENLNLLQAGKYSLAFVYCTASVVAGIAAAWLGFKFLNH
ncbi:MAG: fluoride efflux transporter CrcB [Gloeobacteraceae cyanobacterium ES-bin-316]|nr:fluoride efflux transporter CrcB [Ferruginibacter sp.]